MNTRNNFEKAVIVLSSVAIVLAGLMAVASPFSASAQTVVLGNDSNSRTQLDTASNFTVVDMNHAATAVGSINQFNYYASNTNPFMFLLVNSQNVVQWVSPMITPTAVGMNTYTPTSMVPVQAGWNLGVYFSSTGTIPYENTGASASWTTNASGMPTTGMTLSIAGSGVRTYSFVAESTTTTPTGTAVFGNDTTARTQLDLASNFTVVDTNHPATSAGTITSFGYYASNMNPFNFILVNSSGVVQWVSPTITPAATGMNTYTPTTSLAIQPGWNLGVYFSSTGTIPYENTGASASWTNVNTGMPSATMTLNYAGSGTRTYSFVAYGSNTTSTTPVLTSVTVSPSTKTMNIGGTQQLTISPMDQNSAAFSGATINYSSSNTVVATVSTSGMVTGVSAGSATITATATSGSTTVTGTSAVTVSANGSNGNGGNGSGENLNSYDRLRVRILLNMVKRLLAQLGINETFTSANGLSF